jgi:hypothetical protein
MKNDISPDGRGGTKAAKAFNTEITEGAETSGVESEVFTSHQSLVTSHFAPTAPIEPYRSAQSHRTPPPKN